MIDGKTLHQIMKEHPKEIIMDDGYLNGVIVPSMERYIKEYKKNIEALIFILEEKVAMINKDLEHKCEMSSKCVRFDDQCVTCYRKIIEKLQDTITDI